MSRALRPAVEHAVLAPSSHNTQPWVFRIEDDQLELYADRTVPWRCTTTATREGRAA